jgi:hypothetical protein
MTIDTGDDLDPFRGYLQVLAELHLDRRLRGKLDPSDVIQQTMLRAYSAFGELRSRDSEVLMAWLRRILAITLADAVKHYERDKRDIHLERSIEADLRLVVRIGKNPSNACWRSSTANRECSGGNGHIHVRSPKHSQGFSTDRRFNSSASESVCLSRSAAATSAEACIIATSSS